MALDLTSVLTRLAPDRPAEPDPLVARRVSGGRRRAWRIRAARKGAAALCVAVAALVLVRLLHPPAPEPTVDVVVAGRALPAGTVLTAGDLVHRAVPASLAGSAGTARTTDAVGRILAGAVEAGEPLRASRLVTGSLALPPGRVAVALPLASPALAAAVTVGSRVDITAGGRVLAEDAPVLAVTRPSTAGTGGLGGTASGAWGGAGAAGGEALVCLERAAAVQLSAPSAQGGPSSPPVVLVRAPAS